MRVIVLLLSLWPFHHRKAIVPVPALDPGCMQSGGGWTFYGPDADIGVGASCAEAKHDWRYPATKPDAGLYTMGRS